MENILETRNLCKQYTNFTALQNVNLHIKKGEIYGLIGQNGAGKTTFMRIITGLQEPTDGEFILFGASNKSKDIYKARRRMGGIIETPALQANLTAKENLIAQSILRNAPKEKVEELLEYVGLSTAHNKFVKDMSLGMRQRLAIASALVGNPEFLMLDEPINGLDPTGIIEIREVIHKLNKEHNITVVISSHILGELSRTATSYGFMKKGQVLQEISAAELNERCRKKSILYLTSSTKVSAILNEKGLSHKTLSHDKIELYADITITALVGLISSVGETLLKIQTIEDDLETYYLKLMGEN